MIRRLFFLAVGLGGAGFAVGFTIFYWLVVFDPGEEIQQGNIEKILAVESPVYYRDGVNKIGVFFETSHRQYIPYELIPEDFVNGIVAAEDNKFFEHHGVDYVGILRAMVANLRAGRIVQGGSTITQQTAKNLFKRRDRSLGAKLKELLYAWRLEYHYPKAKILEFYANQFYVSGSGRGLGVAARYYFNKDVSELDVLECAFIAGSVKRPNYYNPFIKNNEDTAEIAKKRAKMRVKYVLGHMYDNGKISKEVFEESVARDIHFQQGQMYYSLNTIMDMIKEAMAEPEVDETFRQHGIDNVATSGIKIITTIEKDLQEETFYSLRKQLSLLDVRLRGYERNDLQETYKELLFGNDREMQQRGFLVGRILSINDDPAAPEVCVSFNAAQRTGERGCIDYQGLMNLLSPLVKYERQLWSKAGRGDLPLILKQLKEGDLVYVSIRGTDPKSGDYLLDLEKYPKVQGGALAINEGTIRAMAGGMENRYYNRAISAQRPMGSVIKPMVYSAALQLGWNSMDVLNNQRDVFVFQRMAYFPRPDHESPYKGVSMNWAGVHSENVATVWLLYHMCDYLSPDQFLELVDNLGMDRLPGESIQSYMRRVRDEMGVVVDREALYNLAFEQALESMEPDLIFGGKLKEYEVLRSFHYGTDFEKFIDETEEEFDLATGYDEDEEDEISRVRAELEETELSKAEIDRLEAEVDDRQVILSKSFLRFKELRSDITLLREEIDSFAEGDDETNLYYDTLTSQYIYTDFYEPKEEWQEVSRPELALITASMEEETLNEFWDNISIDRMLSVSTVSLLEETIEQQYAQLSVLPPYSPEILHRIRDFRVLAALRYLIGLCREIGIVSKLDPVLSFPLGSNVISLLEVVRAYEGMVTGNVRSNGAEGSGDGLSIIERIEGSDGELIYTPTRTVKRVVAPEISLAVSDILRNVIKFGTGRYADRNVRLHSHDPNKEKQLLELDLKVPIVGKTGTANRFTNASFAGVVPGVGSTGSFVLSNGYVLASYVGFDNNIPMVRNTTHITGAAGALPIWSRMAESVLLENDYASKMDLVDLSFSGTSEIPLYYPDFGQIEVGVDTKRGGLVTGEKTEATIITFGETIGGGRVRPTRYFRPYWQTEGN
ncbi:MAG: transglycosylase domain-containing protein [Proteobacteria bacterium]|nr:transglycosylase domain-containing protein [Pseudomonadota bacterium]MBU1715816.1 transglycosylase domain-containing protein [Pseudomonadota bacterium]